MPASLATAAVPVPHAAPRLPVTVADRPLGTVVLASRCNYDVFVGHDREGRRHCGVLEQSWRFGGASMAELLAMERFARQPSLQWMVAETVETYDGRPPPPDAVPVWPGDGESPCKYARIVDDGY